MAGHILLNRLTVVDWQVPHLRVTECQMGSLYPKRHDLKLAHVLQRLSSRGSKTCQGEIQIDERLSSYQRIQVIISTG